MTLRGAHYNAETSTLDLTKVRLSLAQFVAFMLLLGGLIGTQAVALWRIDELSKSMTAMQATVRQIELTQAKNGH